MNPLNSDIFAATQHASRLRIRRRQGAARLPRDDPQLVARRGEEPRDDQLPHVPPREGRPLLREDLRADAGLGVRLRQVQAHQEQGHGLRPLRRRGDARVGAPPAHGPHRARGPREPHLVLQVLALPHRPDPRQDDERARARPLLPGLPRHETRRHHRSRAARSSPSRSTSTHASKYGDDFKAKMGAEAIRELLKAHRPRREIKATSRSRCRTRAPSRTARRSPSA